MALEIIIKSTNNPVTCKSLVKDLSHLGLKPKMTVIVHSSMSALGYVVGGPVAVIQALLETVTSDGTVVMPTHSTDYSDPSLWQNPPVPKEWYQTIKDEMPAFDPRYTPTLGVGKIPEIFRTFPDVLRSNHPALSFSAWGKDAKKITENHSLENGEGENSPLGRVYDLDGWILLLGTDFETNSSFHLGEYLAPDPPTYRDGGPIIENGKRVWKEYNEIQTREDLFNHLGSEFEKLSEVRTGKVGAANCFLFKQRQCVDFAKDWFSKYRASSK